MLTRKTLPFAFGTITLFIIAGFLPGEKPRPLSEPRVKALLEQLGNQSYQQREAATRELKAQPPDLLPTIRTIIKETPNPEIHWRAKKIEWAILSSACSSRSTAMQFTIIEAGEFSMGSPPREPYQRADESMHEVQISQTFLIGAHEVTQSEYQAVMGYNPSWHHAQGKGQAKVAGMNTDRFPVENVTWYDAIQFCNTMSKKDGLPSYYEMEGVEKLGNSISIARVKILGGSGYCLPTEAEWEYACRAGTRSMYHYGNRNTGKEANIKATVSTGYGGSFEAWKSLNRTTTTGSYPANSWRCLDMHGNVAEWCEDWYENNLGVKDQRDPQGPKFGEHRVIRGGSYLVTQGSCRSASRHSAMPSEAKEYIGFRIARRP